MKENKKPLIVTAGDNYLDIDAYACAVAYAELLRLQGQSAAAYSKAPCNYSVPSSLLSKGEMLKELPRGFEDADFIVVDVSDPEYMKRSVPLERVTAVFDHHTGFESYWQEKIGERARIEFIGAAATLIFREWEKAGLTEKMQPATARLLAAAILDNTLNLTSQNTTEEDKLALDRLLKRAGASERFGEEYFSNVQECILQNVAKALQNDLKTLPNQNVLPQNIAQLCVWDGERILESIALSASRLVQQGESLMVNLIDIKHGCSYFWCSEEKFQKTLSGIFGVEFEKAVAKTEVPYLRKEIIKKAFNR